MRVCLFVYVYFQSHSIKDIKQCFLGRRLLKAGLTVNTDIFILYLENADVELGTLYITVHNGQGISLSVQLIKCCCSITALLEIFMVIFFSFMLYDVKLYLV